MIKLLKKHWIIFTIILVIDLFLLCATIISVPYDVTAVGGINQVEKVIAINQEYEEKGSFNTVAVYTADRCSLLTYLFATLSPNTDVSPSYEYLDQSLSESITSGTIQKDVSIRNAIIASYVTAGKSIVYTYNGIIIHTLTTYADSDWQLGDIITSFNGTAVTSLTQFQELVKASASKDATYQVIVSREINDVATEVELTITPAYFSETNTLSFGISLYEYYRIGDADPSYTINESTTIGPSGGLMQALSVYNAITDADYTHGLTIAGTGTITCDGDIGAIGGIYQKIITADKSDVDIFFVPVERTAGEIITTDGQNANYVDALAAYATLTDSNMVLVPVATLAEAIAYLEGLGD